MRKLFFLLIVLLCACSNAFAESLEDVLKDCTLDRSRWKVVEWFKAEGFVRFYDSQSVAFIGSEQFDVVIYDYYYGKTCESSTCKQEGKKHYHSAKLGFDAKHSRKTLRSFATRDADGNVVDSYDYPTNLQIPEDISRESIEVKTMLKVKESVKNTKGVAVAQTRYKQLCEEILHSEADALQEFIPDNFEVLLDVEKKVWAKVEANNARMEKLRDAARKENISDKEVDAFIDEVREGRIAWVKKASAKRSIRETDTVMGLSSGSTWEEIQIVLGKPEILKKEPGGIEYVYDGLSFRAWIGGGKNADPVTWKSYVTMSFHMTGTNYTSDKGVKIGMSRAMVEACLSQNRSLQIYNYKYFQKNRGMDSRVQYCYYTGAKSREGYPEVTSRIDATYKDGLLRSYGANLYI